MLGPEYMKNLFGFHPGTKNGRHATVPKIKMVRMEFEKLGNFLDELIPDGETKNTLIDHLKTAGMWATWAVTEHSPVDPDSIAKPVKENP